MITKAHAIEFSQFLLDFTAAEKEFCFAIITKGVGPDVPLSAALYQREVDRLCELEDQLLSIIESGNIEEHSICDIYKTVRYYLDVDKKLVDTSNLNVPIPPHKKLLVQKEQQLESIATLYIASMVTLDEAINSKTKEHQQYKLDAASITLKVIEIALEMLAARAVESQDDEKNSESQKQSDEYNSESQEKSDKHNSEAQPKTAKEKIEEKYGLSKRASKIFWLYAKPGSHYEKHKPELEKSRDTDRDTINAIKQFGLVTNTTKLDEQQVKELVKGWDEKLEGFKNRHSKLGSKA